MSEPRLLTRTALRLYLGSLPLAEIEHRMKHGLLPQPLWDLAWDHPLARWDRAAVNRALDRASRMPATLEAQGEALDRALGLR